MTDRPPINVSDPTDAPRGFSIRALLELIRLPNVFTAVADILMGFLFTRGGWSPASVLALLVASSACLYLSGMALNDYFDRQRDALERPKRPIPSGRVSSLVARRIGFTLLLLGVGLGWCAAWLAGDMRGGAVATLLAGAVLGYDGVLKRTWLGPLAMGSCRSLNVLLGMSTSPQPWEPLHFVVAIAVGLYVCGITWFARTEAIESRRSQLGAALAVMIAGLMLLGSLPGWLERGFHGPRPVIEPSGWLILIALLGLVIVRRCVQAVVNPEPRYVQAAITQAILSLIVLDAAVCALVRGLPDSIWILALYAPALFLGRWIYST